MFGSFFKTKSNDFDLTPEKFQSEISKEEDAVILDVRTAGEFNGGYIPGAINIDYTDFNFKNRVTQLDKNKTYYLYCRSGNRSGQAASLMQTMGFSKVYNLIGGISAWTGKITG